MPHVVQQLKLSLTKPVFAPSKGDKLYDVPLPDPMAEALREHIMPPPRTMSASRGHDRKSYFFLPWFFTASIAAFAASGSRYVPPGFSGRKSASSS